MLWIDGHIIRGKREEWRINLELAAEIVNDWNCFAINSGTAFVFDAEKRFQIGYHFAAENASKLIEHNKLSGNHLIIAAFGKGIAFAEGIAAFLFEERRIKVHQAIYIYGKGLGKTPQLEEAIKYRIVVGKAGKDPKISRKNALMFKSIYIEENKLPQGYYRYNTYAYIKNEKYPLGFFIYKNKMPGFSFNPKNRQQPALFWNVVSHAINMLETADTIFDFSKPSHSRVQGLFDISYN